MSVSDTSSGAVPRPVIGLTTYLEQSKTGVWDVPASFLPKVYFEAVTAAGGIAVLLPPQPVDEGIADRVLDSLDGLIITGGKDVDPARYGQEPHPLTDEPRRDRDTWEDALLRRAIDRELPFLGICRGAQVLNVALGGTLHQHLPDVIGQNGYQLGGGVFSAVDIAVTPDSTVHSLLGGGLSVPVYHHQAIDRVAEGLIVSATTADGVIEAVELPSVPFGVAVQWHPEEATDDIRLFAGLVDAATTYAQDKTNAPNRKARS
ncbi:gamma-glutamyl-gamma-aminobutyrate hydrolase family protein [Leifsonia sp. A12D58]|uniref:gamma-glutamyl-gamma-aminobutyrate hydrolase family protein n=1 Tax=Leifsonia sp. A12D58 TaxID=3397674 RepID=UPI0039E105CA